MRRMMGGLLLVAFCSVGFVGCSDTASTTTEKKVTTPDGETKVKTETSVEKSGSNPPPANP